MSPLVQHSAALLAGRAVERGLTLIVLAAAALRLGAAELGPLLAALSAGTLVACLCGAGLRRICLVSWPDTPAAERPALIGRLVGQQLVLLTVGGLALAGVALALPGAVGPPGLALGAWLAAALYELAELLRAPFLARGQPGPDTWLPGLTRLGLVAAVLLAGPALDGPTLVAGYALTQAAGTLLSWWLLSGLLTLTPRAEPRALPALAARALAHVVPPSLALLCCHTDMLVLARAGTDQLAAFGLVTRLTLVAAALSGAACATLLPRVPSHLAAGHPARVRHDLARLGRALLLIFGPVSLALAAWGPALLDTLLDGAPGDPRLVGLVAALVPLVAVVGLLAQVLEAGGRLPRVLAVAAAVLALDLALDLALVPRFGALGAALSSLIALLAGLLALGVSLWRAGWLPLHEPRRLGLEVLTRRGVRAARPSATRGALATAAALPEPAE